MDAVEALLGALSTWVPPGGQADPAPGGQAALGDMELVLQDIYLFPQLMAALPANISHLRLEDCSLHARSLEAQSLIQVG